MHRQRDRGLLDRMLYTAARTLPVRKNSRNCIRTVYSSFLAGIITVVLVWVTHSFYLFPKYLEQQNQQHGLSVPSMYKVPLPGEGEGYAGVKNDILNRLHRVARDIGDAPRGTEAKLVQQDGRNGPGKDEKLESGLKNQPKNAAHPTVKPGLVKLLKGGNANLPAKKNERDIEKSKESKIGTLSKGQLQGDKKKPVVNTNKPKPKQTYSPKHEEAKPKSNLKVQGGLPAKPKTNLKGNAKVGVPKQRPPYKVVTQKPRPK